MARVATTIKNQDTRLLDREDVVVPLGEYIVYEYEEGLGCTRAKLIPSVVVLERTDWKTVKFLRVATEADKLHMVNKAEEERKALAICKERIAAHNLPMRLADTVYTFDFSKITFFFTAPGRVDFRGLLRDLTSAFRRTRIMLRQIGVRDETKMLGGIGICGREYCCSSFLKELGSITLKMAHDQGIIPNANKLTGGCGRLLCCLSYELPIYQELARTLPEPGAHVLAPGGDGEVVERYFLHQEVLVRHADGSKVTYQVQDVMWRPEDLADLEEE
jgi:cell fate regulator YaaT (PSP1 superfamily)